MAPQTVFLRDTDNPAARSNENDRLRRYLHIATNIGLMFPTMAHSELGCDISSILSGKQEIERWRIRSWTCGSDG
jgi:hypothetical protein